MPPEDRQPLDVDPALDAALEAVDALLAAAPSPEADAVAADLERAAAIARFEVRQERDGPFRTASFGAVPVVPERPLLPELVPPRAALAAAATPAAAALAALIDALEDLQEALVFRADCCEFTDAVHNSAAYLNAGGHVDRAAAHLLALAARA